MSDTPRRDSTLTDKALRPHHAWHNAVTILLVDDDEIDAMAVKRSFRDLKIANPIVEAHDGIEALDMLRGENGYEKLPPPDLSPALPCLDCSPCGRKNPCPTNCSTLPWRFISSLPFFILFCPRCCGTVRA